jgi:hypothetical protein
VDVLLFLSLAGQLQQIQKGQEKLMATVQEMADEVKLLRTRVEAFPSVINGLESRVTDAIKNSGISAADQALVDQAFADAKAASDVLAATQADAEDGVDEGATGGTGGVGGVDPI